MNIVVPNDWNDAFKNHPDMQKLKERGTVSFFKQPGPEMNRALTEADITVGIRERTRFEADRLAKMPKLKLIAQIGGNDVPHIDLSTCNKQGVLVCHTAGAGGRGTQWPGGMVELTIGMMIAAIRQFHVHDSVIHAGGWPDPAGRTLEGKTLGIIGLGRIGIGVGKAAQYFGMRVVAAGKTLTRERAEAEGVEFTSLDDLFSTADMISVHLKLNDATRGMITRQHLARMKPDAIFVNTSRGPVVDEPALVEALQAKHIGGVALDVFNEEPMPADHPIRKCENALLIGHQGWATQEAYAGMIPAIANVITAFLDGKPVNVINQEALASVKT